VPENNIGKSIREQHWNMALEKDSGKQHQKQCQKLNSEMVLVNGIRKRHGKMASENSIR
jgi:hypothetical protein